MRWFNLEDFKEIKLPEAWLKKVLSNLAFNYFKRKKMRSQHEMNYKQEYIEGRINLDKDISRIEVEDILSYLPWKDQMLLKMRMAGLSYAEIAEAMDISSGSVGTMLSRAMKKFRKEYQGREAEKNNEMSRRR